MRKEVPYHEVPKGPGKVRLVFRFRDGRSVVVSRLDDGAGGVHVCVRAPLGGGRESVLRFSVSAEAARVLGVMLLRGTSLTVDGADGEGKGKGKDSRRGAEGAEKKGR